MPLPVDAGARLLTQVVWLELTNFRNLRTIEFRPVSDGLTVVRGENGAGKTSLLEAISYASTLRSFRGSPREALVRREATSAVVRLEGNDRERTVLIELEISPPNRDQVQLNRQRVARQHDLLEVLRTTVFTPDDLTLVKAGPQERRDFLDDVTVAAEPQLTTVRQGVERILRQRNLLLRQAGGRLTDDVASTLDVWDHQFVVAGTRLTEAREAIIDELAPLTSSAYSRLTSSPAGLELRYRRSFGDDLATALLRSRSEDLKRGITTVGPHRDELEIDSDGLDARTRLSQGRQRCVTLALRLAAHEVVGAHAGSPPVLLLDDAFSELDDATAQALVSELPPGQAILTTAGPIPPGATPGAVVKIENGRIGP